MHDLELLLCARPVDPRISPLLDQLAAWDRPRQLREPLVAELRALVTTELSTGARWTPHYDRALAALAAATGEELLDPGWSYDPEPRPFDRLGRVRAQLALHQRLSSQFDDAQQRGARTLAAAFELLTIGTNELAMWFGLCPDPAALDRRLRAAALAYLRATPEQSPDREVEEALLAAVEANAPRDEIHERRMRWFLLELSQQRQCALGVAITEDQATNYDFTHVPPELLELLGNPFDPKT